MGIAGNNRWQQTLNGLTIINTLILIILGGSQLYSIFFIQPRASLSVKIEEVLYEERESDFLNVSSIFLNISGIVTNEGKRSTIMKYVMLSGLTWLVPGFGSSAFPFSFLTVHMFTNML
jgi:hypothetical protein